MKPNSPMNEGDMMVSDLKGKNALITGSHAASVGQSRKLLHRAAQQSP